MFGGTVLQLNRYRPTPTAPLFVFVDLQKEFTLEGRPLQIAHAKDALENCRKLLSLARQRRFPIAHARLTRSVVAFNDLAHGSEWIEDFRPFGSEMVFEHDSPSCYTCNAFAKMMADGGGTAAILAGLAGSASCLATLIDAYEARHNIQFAYDASSSHALDDENADVMHEAAVRIASQFVDVVRTGEIIEGYTKQVEHAWSK